MLLLLLSIAMQGHDRNSWLMVYALSSPRHQTMLWMVDWWTVAVVSESPNVSNVL